jgi:hypothetical protein
MTQGTGDGRDDPMADEPVAGDAAAEDAARRHGDGGAPRTGEEELFAALERTRADLAAAPAPPLPEGFASRMQAALAAERAAGGAPEAGGAGSGPPVAAPGRPASPGRRPARIRTRPPGPQGRPGQGTRRRRVLACALAAVALAAVVVAGAAVGSRSSAGPAPTAAPPVTTGPVGAPMPVPVSGADPVRALRTGLGARDPGPLTDPARRAGCLVAHGLPADTVPLGSRQVLVDGTPGTLLVLPTGRAARFRLLAVGPACAPGSPSTLVDLTVGG